MRKYGLDWLRIGCVLLLFPFHTARVFDVWEPNYVKDTVNAFSTWFLSVTGFWFMPLMFFLAGIAAYYSLKSRGGRQYLQERIHRLLIPFLAGILLIVPIQGYLARVQQYGYHGDYFSFLLSYFSDLSDLSGYTGGFTPAHLWFILYLFIANTALLPVLHRINAWKEDAARRVSSPYALLTMFIPLSVTEALPAFGGKNLFYYAALFLLGFMAARLDWLTFAQRYRYRLLAAVLVVSAAFLAVAMIFHYPSGYNWPAALFCLLRNLAVWLVILSLTGIALHSWNKPGKLLSYLNRASFPVYVLHQSVLLVIAYFIVLLALAPAAKFLLIVLLSLLATFACYGILRRFRATRWLLGIK